MASSEALPDLVARIRMDLTQLDKGLAAVKNVGTEAEKAGGSNAFGKIKTGLQEVTQQAEHAGRQILRIAEISGGLSEGGFFGKLSAGLGAFNMPLLGALSGVFGLIGGIEELSQKTAEYSSTVIRNSDLLGVNTQQYQTLYQAAHVMGIEHEDLTRTIIRFQKNIEDGGRGLKQQGIDLQALGITSRDTWTALNQLSDALAKNTDVAQRNAIAITLLGRNGVALAEILSKGSGFLTEYGREMAKYGLILDDATLKQGAMAEVVNTRVQLALQGLKQTIGADLMGAFAQLWQGILNAFGDQTKTGIDRTKSAIDNVANAVKNVVGWIISFITGLFDLNVAFGDTASSGDAAIQQLKGLGGATQDQGEALATTTSKAKDNTLALDEMRRSTQLATQAIDDQIAVIRQRAAEFTAALDVQIKALHDNETAVQEQVRMSQLLQTQQDEQHTSYLSHLQDELDALNDATGSQRSSGESLVVYTQKLRKQQLQDAIKTEQNRRAEDKTSTELMLEQLKISTAAKVSALEAQKKAEKDTTDDYIRQLEDRKKSLDRHLQALESANQIAAAKMAADQMDAQNKVVAGQKKAETAINGSFINLSESARKWGEKVKGIFQGIWDFVVKLLTDPLGTMKAVAEKLGDAIGSAIVKGIWNTINGSRISEAIMNHFGIQSSDNIQHPEQVPGTHSPLTPTQALQLTWQDHGHSGPFPPGYDGSYGLGGFPRKQVPFLAGEYGPEIVASREDAQVFTAKQTAHMLGGDGGTYNTYFMGPVADEYVARRVADMWAIEMKARAGISVGIG